MYSFICLFLYSFISLFFYIFICLFIHSFVSRSVKRSVSLSLGQNLNSLLKGFDDICNRVQLYPECAGLGSRFHRTNYRTNKDVIWAGCWFGV